MGPKYIDGDFGPEHFASADFGFHGSSQSSVHHEETPPPSRGPDSRGIVKNYARGGAKKGKMDVAVVAPAQPKIGVTPQQAQGALKAAAAMGAIAGARQARRGAAAPPGGPPMGAPPPMAGPPPGLGAPPPGAGPMPGMKNGGRVKGYEMGGQVANPMAPAGPARPMGPGPTTMPIQAPVGPGMAPMARPMGGMPTPMKEGGHFIKGAIKHEGREKKRASESGRSVHEQMEHDKHISNPSLRSAANLGLRLTRGDLSPRKKK